METTGAPLRELTMPRNIPSFAVLSVVVAHVLALAGQAHARTIRLCASRIFSSVLVAVFAMGAGGLFCGCYVDAIASGTISAPDVFATRYRLQVRRIDATAHATEMIQLQTFGDGAVQQLIQQPICELWHRVLAAWHTHADPRVALPINLSCPQPTAGFGDRQPLFHQAVDQRAGTHDSIVQEVRKCIRA